MANETVSVWERITGIRKAKVKTARQTYLGYLSRLETGSKLSEKDVAAMAEAADAAGVDDDAIASHRNLLDQLATARPAAGLLPAAEAAHSEARARLAAVDERISAMAKEREIVLQQCEQASFSLTDARNAVSRLGRLEQDRQELFGEVA